MSKSTIGTFELFQMFPDAESAQTYFEQKRWPNGAICPACNEVKRINARKDGFYRCNACLNDLTVRTATIFERSKVPLHKWLYAMYLLVAARKGISSLLSPATGSKHHPLKNPLKTALTARLAFSAPSPYPDPLAPL